MGVFTEETPGSVLARGGVRSTPHEEATAALPGHIPLGPRGQQAPGEAPQGVRPGGRGPVDGAAIDPGGHQVHLYGINRTQE